MRIQRTEGNEYLSLDGSGRVDAAGAPQRFEVNDQHSSHYLFGKLAARGALTGLSAQVHLQAWKFQTGHGWLYVIPDEAERANNSEARAWIRYRPPALAGRPAGAGAGGAGPAPPQGLPDQVPARAGRS